MQSKLSVKLAYIVFPILRHPSVLLVKKVKVNFEIYIADRKATTCI